MKKENKQLKVAIRTFGCQMNQYDTEVAEGILQAAGYEIVREGDGTGDEGQETGEENNQEVGNGWQNADILLMNTCSVREHAEERVFGRLGMLGKAKKTHPDLIVGLMGCMVEEHREKLFKRFPYLDLMVGTRNIRELPHLIEEVRKNRQQVSKIKQDGISIEYTDQIKRHGKFHAWLPIMTGCNKVCTFCIVPLTRGREISMPATEIYREACRLVADGVKWITLLGQNVNSYNGFQTIVSFPDLLEMLCKIDGLERISFTTSHPQDATEELFQVIARNPKISRRLHLPLQSGSDRILKRMKRLHTYVEFKAKVDRLRELVPDISITTDIIAGFSGETAEDHQTTIRALAEIRFDGAFIYKYSIREQTPAVKLRDDVPRTVKEARHQELFDCQKRIEAENNQHWLNRNVSVFVDCRSPKSSSEVIGRTNQEKKVVFPASPRLIGTFQKVELQTLRRDTFRGAIV